MIYSFFTSISPLSLSPSLSLSLSLSIKYYYFFFIAKLTFDLRLMPLHGNLLLMNLF